MKKILILVLCILSFSFAITEEEIKQAYYNSYKYEKMQDYKDAIKSLMVVYNNYPKGYTINLRLGWLYYLDGKFANSIYHYEKAIKIIPYSIEAKLGYTLPLIAQHKYKQVEKVLYEIIKSDYYNYYGNLRLAYVLHMQKKFDEAIKVSQKMLYIYPTDVPFLTRLALAKYYSNKKDEAIKIFKDILILDPENITAKSYLR